MLSAVYPAVLGVCDEDTGPREGQQEDEGENCLITANGLVTLNAPEHFTIWKVAS